MLAQDNVAGRRFSADHSLDTIALPTPPSPSKPITRLSLTFCAFKHFESVPMYERAKRSCTETLERFVSYLQNKKTLGNCIPNSQSRSAASVSLDTCCASRRNASRTSRCTGHPPEENGGAVDPSGHGGARLAKICAPLAWPGKKQKKQLQTGSIGAR